MSQTKNGKRNPFEGWTTIEEAAELVGRHNTTVRAWADRGFIESYPIGRKVRVVNIEELRAYAKTRRENRKN